jgi:hypothetical protein
VRGDVSVNILLQSTFAVWVLIAAFVVFTAIAVVGGSFAILLLAKAYKVFVDSWIVIAQAQHNFAQASVASFAAQRAARDATDSDAGPSIANTQMPEDMDDESLLFAATGGRMSRPTSAAQEAMQRGDVTSADENAVDGEFAEEPVDGQGFYPREPQQEKADAGST